MKLLFAVFACAIVAASASASPPAKKPPSKQKRSKPVTRARKVESKGQPAVSPPRQQAYIDPETGELREGPPPGATVGGISGGASATVITTGKDGSITAELGREHIVYTVVAVSPDGTVSEGHLTAAEVEKASKQQKTSK